MIAPPTLAALAAAAAEAGFDAAGVARVRAGFPDLHLVWALDDEMGVAEPYREGDGFNLYLIQAGDHCLGLTDDPAAAYGVVIAEVEA